MRPSCRNCAFYDLAAILSSNGRIVPGRVARCLFDLSTVSLPASVCKFSLPQSKSYMEPKGGEDCATFKARENGA